VFRSAGLLHYFSWSKVVMHSPPEPTPEKSSGSDINSHSFTFAAVFTRAARNFSPKKIPIGRFSDGDLPFTPARRAIQRCGLPCTL
ncbi:hypothetical protein QP923_10535, partial [Corynebacterium sp. MSK151]|uniref:hypothetical protein n=1 Tax=unclassified Corynebacterium TaxID=2624378 RepID=UPI0025504EC7